MATHMKRKGLAFGIRAIRTTTRVACFSTLTAWLAISDATAADLFGTVTIGGKPAKQVVTVHLNSTSGRAPSEVRTDSVGRFTFTGIQPGDYTLACGGKETPVHVGYVNGLVDCKL
jgi:hypothetical protein